MSIWFNDEFPVAYVNDKASQCVNGRLGIVITEAGDDYLRGEMPVDERTRQPAGFLHGGSSALFAETLASWAATFVIDPEQYHAVGLELNASHMRPGMPGETLTGTARPLKIGRTVQFWNVEIVNQDSKIVCASRVTMAVQKKPSQY